MGKNSKMNLVPIVFLLVLFGYWLVSEYIYLNSITPPKEMVDVKGYFHHFKEPLKIYVVENTGEKFYQFYGQLPGSYSLALPSSPPAYVFNEKGEFVEWCRDPGDSPSFREKWKIKVGESSNLTIIKKQFQIK